MKGKKKFLLESSQLHQDKGRYSYLGCNPYGEVKSAGTEVERTIYDRSEKLQSNVLQVLEEIIASAQVDSPFLFCGEQLDILAMMSFGNMKTLEQIYMIH